MKKKFCFFIVVILLMASGSPYAFATTADSPSISLNGEPIASEAVIQDGIIYLPFRAISESLDYQVSWTQANQTASISAGDQTISLNFNTWRVKNGEHEYYIGEGPVMINNRIFLPPEFYAQNYSIHTQWDQLNNTVKLNVIFENAISVNTMTVSSETKALKKEIQYPVISDLENKAIQDQINAAFKKLADQAEQQGVKNAADLAPVLIQYPDMPGQCQTIFDYRINFNRNNLLSVVFLDYQYAGGAHGSTVQTSLTYDLKTGKAYSLRDLFIDQSGYVSLISQSVALQLKERDLTSGLFEPFTKISEDQSFYLSDNGIVIYFQQYEILPYVAGIQGFDIDYETLLKILIEPERLTAYNLVKEVI